MHSRIRIGLFALSVHFLFAPFLTFAQTKPYLAPPLDSLDFYAMQKISSDLFRQAEHLESLLRELEEKAGESLHYSASRLAEDKTDSTVSKQQLDSLSKEVKDAKLFLKKRSQQFERAKKGVVLTKAMLDMTDSLLLRKNLPKAWRQISQLHDEIFPPEPTETIESEIVEAKEPKSKKRKKQKASTPDEPVASTQSPITNNQSTVQPKKFAAYNPVADVMLHPPTPACVIASSSRDEFSGEVSRQMARAELFRFTNPALFTYLEGKTHVICEAALASAGPNAALHLTFTINDPNARKAFGRLDKNSVATLKFIDGSTFMLQNAVPDDGVYSPETGATIFRAQYPLTAELLKKMRRTELDKLRIAWSNGFDDYEVQQVDLLIRQAECLFK